MKPNTASAKTAKTRSKKPQAASKPMKSVKTTTPPRKPFIPRKVFEAFIAFRNTGHANALMYFLINPDHDEWAPWIMNSANYAAAVNRYTTPDRTAQPSKD